MGGAPKAIEKGYMQREIQESAYRYQMDVEAGRRVVVGVNRFRISEENYPELLEVDPLAGEIQKRKIASLKNERDNQKVENTLKSLKSAAATDANLMPFIIDAVKAYATLGEICDILREVFGEYQQTVIL